MSVVHSDTPTIRWWQALNPAIYLVSILPGVAVVLLATTPISHAALWPATFAVVLLQHGINLLNDAKDWQLGADTEKHNSWVHIHNGNALTVFYHGMISLLTGGILGLLILALHQKLWILGFALPLVVLGVLYNVGSRPLSYTALGEWATALCYGPGVFGGLWFIAAQPFNEISLFSMVAFAAFSTALLFSHQPPQIETDRQAGKNSFAVRHGASATYRVSVMLFVTSLFFLAMACLGSQDLLTTTVFILGAIVTVVWIKKVGPNPRRILLSATLVLLSSLLTAIFNQYA
ncbi:MAG: prenyltransferase [Porticoccus sp.]|nr:prenyltransferase [Porticoccus sp.]